MISLTVLTGCTSGSQTLCQGLTYSESGLTREQFRPCAAEMVKQLDRAHGAVKIMADKTRPREVRTSAKQECLSASINLARLWKAAGGSTKLTAKWDDTRLNEFNMAVMSAKDYYTMICYYGPQPFDRAGKPLTGAIDPGHEKARQILAEIR